MFRKPVRTYVRKNRPFNSRPVSSINTIIRDEILPDWTIPPSRVESPLSNDGSLDYDPFDTTFDRLVKDVIEHPIPKDQTSDLSYDDSSDDETAKRNSFPDKDPLQAELFISSSPQAPRRPLKKLGIGKRARLGSSERSEATNNETKTRRRRGKLEAKDENAEPNAKSAETKNKGIKKKNVRKKARALEKRGSEETIETTFSDASKKSKFPDESQVLRACSVRLKRLSFSSGISSAPRDDDSGQKSHGENYEPAETSSTFESPNSPDCPTGGDGFELSENPADSLPPEVSEMSEQLADSMDVATAPDDFEEKKITEKLKRKMEEKGERIGLESVDSSDLGLPTENVTTRAPERPKILKKPAVSLSTLSFPKKVMRRNFSSSTPILTRVIAAGNSLLRLSPIQSNLNEDFEEPFPAEAQSLALESDVQAVDSVSKDLTPAHESAARPALLRLSPDPEPSGLLFSDEEGVPEVSRDRSCSPKLENRSEPSQAKDSSTELDQESPNRETSHLVFDKTEDSFRFSSGVSSSGSSMCNNEETMASLGDSSKDPFMGFSEERAQIPKVESASDESRNDDDDWITISGSLSLSRARSFSGARENLEQLSSGENNSSDEITGFVRAEETVSDESLSTDDRVSVQQAKGQTSDEAIDSQNSENSIKSRKYDFQLNNRPLEPVVLLSRLTPRKIHELMNKKQEIDQSLSRTIKSLFEMSVDDDLTSEESLGRSKSFNETCSDRSGASNHFEEGLSEMESLRVDNSSENPAEDSSIDEKSEGNSGNFRNSLNVNLSVENWGKSEVSLAESKSPSAEESRDFNRAENSQNLEDEQRDSLQPIVLLSRLDDSYRISRRRRERRTRSSNLSAISEIEPEKVSFANKKLERRTRASKMEDIREEVSQASTLDVTENSQNLNEILQRCDQWTASLTPITHDESAKEDKVVYLKPGKSWARSLSILNHVHSREDLEFMAVGKGRKWRQSVQNILEMQQKGLIQSCVKKNEDSKELSLFTGLRDSTAWIPGSSQPDTSRLFGIASPGRFIRRVSIRVVPDCKSFDNIKDTSFLEAYGINPIENKQTTTQRTTLKDLRKTLDVIPKGLSSTKPRDVVLAQCGQDSSLPFDECYSESYLENCRKIGEGVYGEVFLYEKGKEKNVIKIIPIEGETKINNERQKKFDEILSEIVIAKELHNLRFADKSTTNCFVEVKKIRCVKGKYPKMLIDLWKTFDEEKNSENDCPSIFEQDQLYIVLELGHGGEDLEAYVFQNAREAHALFMQTALALAVAEESLEFEHRDLHWGNILISRTDEPEIEFKLDKKSVRVSSRGVKVSVIDFTLSRMSYQGCSIFNDLSVDEDLFVAQGEYQFEIYRLMRKKLENNWQRFEPYTNILWLHYVLDKMITSARYRRKNTKIHKTGLLDLESLKNEILEYNSAVDFVSNCDKATRLQLQISNESGGRIARNNMQDFGLPIKKAEPEVVPLNTMFEAYCRMDPLSDAKRVNLLPLSQLNVWLTSARILDMSRVTTTDTGMCFFKFRKRAISYDELIAFMKDLTATKGLDLENTKKKMQTCPIPVHPRDFKVKAEKK